MTRRWVMLAAGLCAALSLAACGRKGAPRAPEGSFYPHRYPEITFPAPSQAAPTPPPTPTPPTPTPNDSTPPKAEPASP